MRFRGNDVRGEAMMSRLATECFVDGGQELLAWWMRRKWRRSRKKEYGEVSKRGQQGLKGL